MSEQTRNDVAVFIDFENVYVGVRDKLDANPNFEIIMERCNELGRCILARAYADWYRYPRITSALYANNIEPMYVPTYYYDKDAGRTGRPIKNSADMNLCIDAMRTLFMMPGLKTFVLVTGDRDFIPLVHAIRQHGKDVVIIGVGGAASSHLAQSADEFIFYEHLVGKTIATPAATAPSRRISDIDEYERPREQRAVPAPKPERKVADVPASDDSVFELLAKAILEARARNMAGIGSLQLLMKELSSGEFRVQHVRDAHGRPIEKFKEFINEAARRGKVVISTDGAANEVFLPGEDPRQLSRLVVTPEKAPEKSTPERKERELSVPHVEPSAEPANRGDNAGKSRRRRRRTDSAEYPVSGSDTALDIIVPTPVVRDVSPVELPAAPMVSDDTASEAGTSELPTTSLPFSDEERGWVRAMVAASERPMSFQQIHDQLRDKRKREDGIQRTNEELRSLIKLAINTGELQRIGRGNRVSYRVSTVVAVPTTPPDGVAEAVETLSQLVEEVPAARGEIPSPQEPVSVTAPDVINGVVEALSHSVEEVPVARGEIPSPQEPVSVDDGLDGIAAITAPSRAKRAKTKPTTSQAPESSPRKPARQASSQTDTPRKSSPKANGQASRTTTSAPIPSPVDDPTIAPAPVTAPRRRKKNTE